MVIPAKLKSLYPFRSQYFDLKPYNQRLHYIDEGQGECIVCVHGNPTWSFYFRNIVSQMRSTHRVIALDHLGCGLSSKPQKPQDYHLEQHIENLNKLLEHLKVDQVTLLVHDWGGAIGLGWATRNLKRVKRLVLLNTAAFLSKDIPKRIHLLKTPYLGPWLIRKHNVFCRSATYMASAKGLSQEVKEALLLPYNNYQNRIAVSSFVKDIPWSTKHRSYKTLQEIENKLPKLRVPTLCLWGAKDFCFHTGFLKRWQKIYPHAQSITFHDASHYVLEDAPEACISNLKRFMSSS